MTSLITLFIRYGYLIAILGLLGTIIVEQLKTPLNKLLASRFPRVLKDEQKFDVVAFLMGFMVAAILAVSYSLVLSYTNILHTVNDEGILVVERLSVLSYFTNILGVWMFQMTYYSIYKKLGIKRLLSHVVKAIIKYLDVNKNGKVEPIEILGAIHNMVEGGADKAKEEAIKMVTDVSQSSISSIIEDAQEAATIDQEEQIDVLAEIVEQAIGNIPEKSTMEAASDILKEASLKAKEIADSPKLQRPRIKF